MRMLSVAWFAFVGLVAVPALAASAAKDPTPPAKTEHPGEVALVEESNGYAYLAAPSRLRLYVSDRDSPGKSSCDESCAYAWPPLIAREGAKPMGYWTIITRDDGRRQWAYKGHPVYYLFHDSPDQPAGNGIEGIWHFLEP